MQVGYVMSSSLKTCQEGIIMNDFILRATDRDNHMRIFVAETKELVEQARVFHTTTPVATAALGRLLTASSMMGIMMKGDDDVLTLQINGDGPLGTVLATADAKANVKGYVDNNLVDLPLKDNGKLDVSSAVGKGTLTVIKDIGMKDPYNGTIELISGEVADDLTYYFASSEQTPSVVALGVLVDVDYSVKQSGGFILQLMPECPEEKIQQIEKNLSVLPSVTNMLENGLGADGIIAMVMNQLDPVIREKLPTQYHCDCSKEKVEKVLMTIGKKDLQELIDEGEPVDMTCHFCNTHYKFSVEDVENILKTL